MERVDDHDEGERRWQDRWVAADAFRTPDDAAEYVRTLADADTVPETLSPNRERAALERAGWLFRDEFDATVEVRFASEATEDERPRARPGRPAIRLHE